MTLSCQNKKIIKDNIKLPEIYDQKNKNDNAKLISNFNQNIKYKNNEEIVSTENIISKQKESKTYHPLTINLSESIKNKIDMSTLNNIKDNLKSNTTNNIIKNEKNNILDAKSSSITNTNNSVQKSKLIKGNKELQNQNIFDNRKYMRQTSNIIIKKEKDTNINNDSSHILINSKNSTKLNSNLNSNLKNKKHINNEIPKRPNIKNKGSELERPIIKKKPPFIPTISDNKIIEKVRVNVPETKKVKDKTISKNLIEKHEVTNNYKNLDNENLNTETETMTPISNLKSTLSNSQAMLIANTEFKIRKEIINKRIVKAITKYKPSIEVPVTLNNEKTLNIYKSAHLEFCRNCLIPKDVLYFQGLILFKNISKLKEMKLSRQQINNALEWEVIKYTVFNSKSTDNWSTLLNQYKNDRTSTKILTKRYAARKQGQKCVRKETENFERKFIAYNIIKKKALTIMDYYNSIPENSSKISKINESNGKIPTASCSSSSSNSNNNNININVENISSTNKSQINMNNDCNKNSIKITENNSKNISNTIINDTKEEESITKFLYNDIGSLNDYKRIFSKVIEQRVKVAAKNKNIKSSPLKQSLTIDYTTKLIRKKNDLYDIPNISFKVNNIKDFVINVYPHKLMKNSNFYTNNNDENDVEIENDVINCNISFINEINNNNKKNDFNNLISYYLYYLLNIFHISLPSTNFKKKKFKGLDLNISIAIYNSLVSLLNNDNCINNYNNCNIRNPNYSFSNFTNIINYTVMSNCIKFTKEENQKNTESDDLLLKIPEQLKIFISNYLINYILSPKNRISSLRSHTKRTKIIYLIFTPLISYSMNKLNVYYLKHDKNYMKYKNESIKNHKKQLKLLKKSNKKRKIPNYIWDSKNEENSNIMVKYFNNNKNYFTKKTLVDTVYPLINKAVNLIQMPNPNKEYSIINHIHQNKNNEEMNLSPPATENKTINNKKLSFNETIQNKIIFFLPELNNSKSLNYKKIVMDSFLTFSSLRQRKNCTQTNSDSICYINNYFSYKNKTSQVDNDCNYFFEGTRLRYVRIKAIKKKKRKPLKEVTLKKYYMKLQNDFNSKNLKSNNYILSNKREKVYILNYLINQSQKSSSIQNDNNILLLPSKLQKNKTYRSKTNLITKEKPKKKNKALKIYEIYDNPDEDKINYIKRVYKKKYKKLITNELENESYNSDNLNNSDEKNDIFYLEIYKTKNNVIDLNKNKRESSNNSIESIENHEKIIIEFIQKKYNIIDLNQRKIEFNRNIIENYSVPSEDASVINTADKSNFSSKINSINNFIPSLNTSIFNFSSSIMNMIDSKSSASLSISEITSKETVNRSEDNNSYICNCSSCISTNNNNTNACNNNNSNRYSSCSSNNNNNIILSELENEKIYLGTVKQSSDRTSISSYPNEDEVKINNNNYNNDNMKIKNKTLSLRSLLRSFSSPS